MGSLEESSPPPPVDGTHSDIKFIILLINKLCYTLFSCSGGSIAPFCNRLSTVKPKKRSCNLDRTAISQCNLIKFSMSLPKEYQVIM